LKVGTKAKQLGEKKKLKEFPARRWSAGRLKSLIRQTDRQTDVKT